MGSFGENLRREREMRGISLEEISASTRVSVRFLEAIENDDFASLPGGIFTRSFIRSYAKYMGLDDDQIIAEYQLAAQPKDVELDGLMFAKSKSTTQPQPRSLLVPILVAAAMLAGGYALFRYAHRPAETPVTAAPPPRESNPANSSSTSQPTAGDETATNPAPKEVQGQPPSTTAAQKAAASKQASQNTVRSKPGGANSANTGGAGSAPTVGGTTPEANTSTTAAGSALPASSATTADGEMVLQVAATQRVWVDVEADGKTVLQRTLNPNDIRTLRAKDYFEVMTGNAQGLILTLDGETLKPLGRQGEVTKIRLTHADIKPPSP